MGCSRLVLKMEVIDLHLQGHFGHFDLEFKEIWLVRTITCHRFGLESQNLPQTCIMGYTRLVLKMEVIDLDLQGHIDHFVLEFWEIWLVHAITGNGFELESPNWHQICILGFSQLLLKMGVIDLDLQGHLTFSAQETEFNIALVYWSRPAKGCFMSQICSCAYLCELLYMNLETTCNFLQAIHMLTSLLMLPMPMLQLHQSHQMSTAVTYLQIVYCGMSFMFETQELIKPNQTVRKVVVQQKAIWAPISI